MLDAELWKSKGSETLNKYGRRIPFSDTNTKCTRLNWLILLFLKKVLKTQVTYTLSKGVDLAGYVK